MKKLKLLCSAIAALTLFALASCDLEVRDKFEAFGPTAVHVASGDGDDGTVTYTVYLGLDGNCSGTRPKLLVNSYAIVADIDNYKPEDVDTELYSTSWNGVKAGEAYSVSPESSNFIVLYEFEQIEKGPSAWNQFWVAVAESGDFSTADGATTTYYQRCDDHVNAHLGNYDTVTHTYPTGEANNYDYTGLNTVAVIKTTEKITIAVFSDLGITDESVKNYLKQCTEND